MKTDPIPNMPKLVEQALNDLSDARSKLVGAQCQVNNAQRDVEKAESALKCAKDDQNRANEFGAKYLQNCGGGGTGHVFQVLTMEQYQLPSETFREIVGWDRCWDRGWEPYRARSTPTPRYEYRNVPGAFKMKGSLVCSRCAAKVDFDNA